MLRKNFLVQTRGRRLFRLQGRLALVLELLLPAACFGLICYLLDPLVPTGDIPQQVSPPLSLGTGGAWGWACPYIGAPSR